MFNRKLLVPAILSVAGLVMGAGSAFAQHGGGHGGGGHASGGHASGGHASGGGHSSVHVSGGHSGGHVNVGYGGGGYNRGNAFRGGGYGYYPGVFGGSYPWYDNGLSYGSFPSYPYYNAPAVQYYDPPAQPYVPYVSSAPVANDYANIRVIVPDAQAHVWFDGNATSQVGTERLFNTPALTMGSAYSYQIRATWMQDGHEVSQIRTASVTPGQTTTVDFAH